MSIRLATADGIITVGGAFPDALAAIKGLPQRRYDPATKTWSTPLPAAEVARRISLPLDLPNGDHRTKFGNTWDRADWNEYQEAERAADQAAGSFTPALDEIEQAARAEMAALGMSNPAIAMVLAHIYDPDYLASLRYSSPEKRELVLSLADRYTARLGTTYAASHVAQDAAREQIYQNGPSW